jgi:peptide-N4-(N-acetyl-beta-glucosaminyl)asparagine amidase
MDIIPLQKLYEEAEAKLEELEGEGSLEDLVIQRLMHWFKNDFFSWVNDAPCDYCHSVRCIVKEMYG